MWPLVAPMNAVELTYGADATIALASALATGVSVAGAHPTSNGTSRLIGGVRVIWLAGRTETVCELQHGFAGDPFEVRALIGTTFRFE